MTTPKHVAYQGHLFAIEWYFDEKGHSQPLDYYNQLDDKQQNKVFELFRRLGEQGEIRNQEKFRHEGDAIYAFKPKPDRFLCFFFTGKKVIVTNAFEKKQNKLPSQEKIKALKYKSDYESRVERGKYYE